jgi:inner membrane protein
MLPDIDQGDSYVGQMTWPFSRLVQFIFGHRKIIHSPLWTIFIIWLLYKIGPGIPKTGILIEMIIFSIFAVIMFIDRIKLYVVWLAIDIVMMLFINTQFTCQGFYYLIITGLSIGIVSHLLLDAMTMSGIPLFYPFSGKTFSIAKLQTNRHEIIVMFLSILALVLVIGFKYLDFHSLIVDNIINKIKMLN